MLPSTLLYSICVYAMGTLSVAITKDANATIPQQDQQQGGGRRVDARQRWRGGNGGFPQTGDCKDFPDFGVVNPNIFLQGFGVANGADLETRSNQCFDQCHLECHSRPQCTGFQWNSQHDGVQSVCKLKTGQITFVADPGQCDDQATGRSRCFSFSKNVNSGGAGGSGSFTGGCGDCRKFPGPNANGGVFGFIPRPGNVAIMGQSLPGYPMAGLCFDSCSSACQENPDCGGFEWKKLDLDGIL